MKKELNFFKSTDYKYISNFIENKIDELRKIEKYNDLDQKNISLANKLEESLNEDQKNTFEEYLKTIYELEEFYFAFAYSLGVKYGKDIENL